MSAGKRACTSADATRPLRSTYIGSCAMLTQLFEPSSDNHVSLSLDGSQTPLHAHAVKEPTKIANDASWIDPPDDDLPVATRADALPQYQNHHAPTKRRRRKDECLRASEKQSSIKKHGAHHSHGRKAKVERAA